MQRRANRLVNRRLKLCGTTPKKSKRIDNLRSDSVNFYSTKRTNEVEEKQKTQRLRKNVDKYIVREIERQLSKDEGKIRLAEKRDKNIVSDARKFIHHNTAALSRNMRS